MRESRSADRRTDDEEEEGAAASERCLSFAENTAKCRIAGRRLLGHTVAHDGDGIYQDTCFARYEGAGE